MSHSLLVLHRIGEETGIPLKSAACTCGWRAQCWYRSDEGLAASYALHTHAIATGSTNPWMIAPATEAAR
jgi:hypothetical protein